MALPFSLDEITSLSLLRHVDVEALAPLMVNCVLRRLPAEEMLLSPDSPRDGVYLIVEGELRVHLQTPDDEPVSMLKEGEGVGELSLLIGAPRSAFVIADTDCRLLHIPAAAFWALLEASHQLTLNYLRMLSRRLRKNNDVVLENRALQELYKRHAMTDGLTGLHNRRWFDHIFTRLFARSLRQESALSVIMLDIDHFKHFNDTFGHQAGDFALFALAQILKKCFRPTDLLARYGGEEFVVMMPQTSREEALQAAERVRREVAQTKLEMPDGQKLDAYTISLGVACLAEGHDTGPAELLKRADEALYCAKERGRNRVELASPQGGKCSD